MDAAEVFERTAALRREVADLLETLTPEQWTQPSLCGAWTVRDVAGHLVVPLTVTLPTFVLAMVRARGNFDAANDRLARQTAARLGAGVAGELRARAGRRFVPPGGTAWFQLVDVMVHGQDIRRPLGIRHAFDPVDLREALGLLTSPAAARGFVPKSRLEGLRLVAADADTGSGAFEWGAGALVEGRAEAMLMALTGRRAGLAELAGPGVEILRRRV